MRKNCPLDLNDDNLEHVRVLQMAKLPKSYIQCGNMINCPRPDAIRKRKSRQNRKKLKIDWKREEMTTENYLIERQEKESKVEMERFGRLQGKEALTQKQRTERNARIRLWQPFKWVVNPFCITICSPTVC